MINLRKRKLIRLAFLYPQSTVNFLTDKIFYSGKTAPFPRIINCFVTEACNFNCPMCHVKESRQKNMAQLSFNDLQKLIKEVAPFFPSFQLTGGEPLLHPDIEKIVKLLTDRKMVKGLVTNGLLLEEKAELLVSAGLDFLAVSLDGPDEKTQFERGYVKGSYDKIIRGIRKVLEVRGKKLFPNIRIATVVSRINLNNFDQVLGIAEDLGVDQWSLSHYFFFPEKVRKLQESFARKNNLGRDVWGEAIGDENELFDINQRQIIKEKMRKITNLVKLRKNKVKIVFQPDIDIDKYYRSIFPSADSVCELPYNQVFVRGNGEVEMCQGYTLGNIRNGKIREIWNNDKAQHFRKIFAKNKIMPACFRCCALRVKFD